MVHVVATGKYEFTILPPVSASPTQQEEPSEHPWARTELKLRRLTTCLLVAIILTDIIFIIIIFFHVDTRLLYF